MRYALLLVTRLCHSTQLTCVYTISRHLGYVAQGTITVRMKIFKAVHMAALNKFISRKATSVEERDYFVKNDIVKITWKEKNKRECVATTLTAHCLA